MAEWYDRALKKSKWIDDCLEFNGHRNKGGYGTTKVNGKMELVHRVSYRQSKGEIPEGLIVRHTCDNPSCWNPDHLILGTHKDNMKDMVDRDRSAKGSSFNIGSKNKSSKLNESQIIEIKSLLETNKLSQTKISQMYSVAQAQISKIKLNKTWRHVS